MLTMEKIILESEINNDNYTEFVYNSYDIQNKEKSIVEVPMVNLEELAQISWNLGLIIGNSGSGKSTILKRLGTLKTPKYDPSKCVISQFQNMDEKSVCDLFYSVGLSSVPCWLRKPQELSNGEKARLDICWHIANAEDGETILIDEWTSVVNRDVAKSMSFALQRYVRQKNLKIIVASCHYDIIEWLQPDWVYNLNKQDENGETEIEQLVYSDSSEYKAYSQINDWEILSDAKSIY